MARRGLDPDMIRLVLDAPDAVLPGNHPGRRIYHRQMDMGSPSARRLLRVVVEEHEGEIVVVTAYASSRLERYQGGP